MPVMTTLSDGARGAVLTAIKFQTTETEIQTVMIRKIDVIVANSLTTGKILIRFVSRSASLCRNAKLPPDQIFTDIWRDTVGLTLQTTVAE